MAEEGYYGYAERQASNQINWAEVGSNMSKMLLDENRIREKKKTAIDDASRELGEELANAPTGTYDAGNEFVLGYAENAQQFRMMSDVLLKSGRLKLKDYTLMRENINSDTDTLFSLAQEYQTEFAEKMERYDNDESAFLEVWEMEQVEGMANLNGVKATPNPTNGIVTLLNKDGSTMTVNGMRSRLKNRYDRFDIDEETKNIADSLGVDVRMTNDKGELDIEWEKGVGVWLTTADSQKKEDYEAMENDKIQSILANPYNTASVLVDHGAKGEYTFINSASVKPGYKAKANEIVIDYTKPVSERVTLTTDQEKAAADVIRRQIRTKIDTKVTAQFKNEQYTPEQRAAAQLNAQAGFDFEKQLSFAQNIGSLFGGTEQEMKTSESAIRAINPSIERLDRDNDGVKIFYNDGNSETIEFKQDGKFLTEDQFIESMYNFVAPTIDGKTLAVTDFKKLAEKGMSKEREFMLLGEGEMISDYSYDEAIEKIVSDLNKIQDETLDDLTADDVTLFVNSEFYKKEFKDNGKRYLSEDVLKYKVINETIKQINNNFKNIETTMLLDENRIEVKLPGKESIYLDLSDSDNLIGVISKLETYIKKSGGSSGSSNTVNYGEK